MTSQIKKKLYTYFTESIGAKPYTRGWLKSDCPMCGRKDKFGINLYSNRTNCFVCGYNKPPIFLLIDLENLVDIREAYIYLKTVSESTYFYDRLKVKEEVQQEYKPQLPEGYKNIIKGDNRVARLMRNYVKKRGFNIEYVSKKGWGYCTSGKYLGYLIMPYYSGNRVIYYNARRVFGTGPKFNNPPTEEFGIGKNQLIYNIDSLYQYRKIYLFESVTNAETIGDNTIAIGGKKLSTFQRNVILKSPVEKIIVGLDKDAYEDALKIAFSLYPHKEVKVLKFKDERDVNDLGRKKVIKLSRKCTKLKFNDILKLKLENE